MSADTVEMRKFGVTTGAIIVLLFGLVLPWLFEHEYPLWPWIPAGLLWLMAAFFPGSLVPVHSAWMRVGHVLGWINSRIILGVMFFTVFFIIALILKLLGKDPMSRKIDKNIDSYRVRSQPRERDHLEKPF